MSEMYSKEEVLNAFDVALVSASNKVKIKNKAKTELKYRFLEELGIDYTALIFYKDDVQKMQIKALCPQDEIVREFERCIAVTPKAYKKLRMFKAVKKRTVIYILTVLFLVLFILFTFLPPDIGLFAEP